MIVFEPLAAPGSAAGDLLFTGFGRRTATGAFGFLSFDGSAGSRTLGRAHGRLLFDGFGTGPVTGGRAFGFLGFAGEAAARVSGAAQGWLVFDRQALVPGLVPIASGYLDFEGGGSGGYRRTQINDPLGTLWLDGRAHSAALGGVARGELFFESVPQMRFDPDAVSGLMAASAYIAASTGAASDTVSDGLTLGVDATVDVSTLLLQQLRLRSAAHSSSDSAVAVEDTAVFAEAMQLTYLLLVAEGFRAGASATELHTAVERTADGLLLTGVVGTEAEAFSFVALGLLLGIRSDALLRETLLDAVQLGDSLASQIEQVVAALSRLRTADAVSHTAVLAVLVSETFTIGDSADSTAEAFAALSGALRAGVRLSLDTGEYTAWVLNTESKHLSSYAQFPINSFAEIGGRLYGASDDGIYLLEGDDDAGEPIAARVRFALTTLGTGVQKRVPSAYLGYTANGELLLRVIHTDELGGKQAYTYRMNASPAVAPVNGRVKFGRGVKSAYYAFELSNVDGSMFDVDTLNVYPLALDRRITRN